jgi:hypothetical protein
MRDSDRLPSGLDESLQSGIVKMDSDRHSPMLSALPIQIFQRTADFINWDSDWLLLGHGSKWI